MFTRRHILSAILTISALHGYAGAQEAGKPAQAQQPAAVTAAPTTSGARFTAPGEALQLRLEVYTTSGERVYDSGPRPGGVLDWSAAGLADGQYISVLTVRDLKGRTARRLGAVALQSGAVSLSRLQPSELTAEQAQALKVDAAGDDSLAVLKEGKERAVTVTAHDGAAGQVTSTSGDLTLRTGDVFTGQEREQVRVTSDGRVGVGTAAPEDTLDVAGTIRARGGIRFADGTVLTSASQAQTTTPAAAGVSGETTTATASGTGTANRLARWLDGAGTLGDSNITESGGNVGVGTANPTQRFEVSGNTKFFAPAGSWTLGTAHHLFASGDGSPVGFQNTRADGGSGAHMYDNTGALRALFQWNNSGAANGNSLNFATAGSERITFATNLDQARMTIAGNGNVGGGTVAPQSTLQVSG